MENRAKLTDLRSTLSSSNLAPKIIETTAGVDVVVRRGVIRSSQAELRRLGCYRGTENGNLDDATKDALKRENVARDKADAPLEIDDAVLSDLKKLEAPMCTPPKSKPEEKPVASRPKPKMLSRPSQPAPVREDRPSARPNPGGIGRRDRLYRATLARRKFPPRCLP